MAPFLAFVRAVTSDTKGSFLMARISRAVASREKILGSNSFRLTPRDYFAVRTLSSERMVLNQHSFRLIPRDHFAAPRAFSSGHMKDEEIRSRLNTFQDLFVEARLCIEDCADAADTVYFDEEAKSAADAVDEALSFYEDLLEDLHESQRNDIRRSNGLKVEQLKGELKLAAEGGH